MTWPHNSGGTYNLFSGHPEGGRLAPLASRTLVPTSQVMAPTKQAVGRMVLLDSGLDSGVYNWERISGLTFFAPGRYDRELNLKKKEEIRALIEH